ncbi:MAG TPA: DUF6498-containing protein [Steroidobacteraceae bacterium]|nr:DUF6498-containing protein [Steroidobacteraceae bacterium]
MVSPQSTLSLVVVNVATLAVALGLDWPVSTLLWPYWIQSVVIGYYSRKRILALGRFSTENFTMNDQPVSATPATQRSVANFFTLHYGFFHFGYLMFLIKQAPALPWWDALGWLALGLSFAWNHRLSFQQNVDSDRQGTPNIGTLMFLPYARILPMHFTIILGGTLAGSGSRAVLVFGALKTVADVLMHYVEHRVLQRSRTALPV